MRTVEENLSDLLEKVKQLATELEASLERLWIPVTERLPEKDGNYLVTSYTYDKSKVYVTTRLFIDGEWVFCGKDIVAWVELPKPYKEGSEEDGLHTV